MFAFRAAHEQKDSRRSVDLRDEAGERVLASRRTTRMAITEMLLRREVARDLEHLMNTIALESTLDLDEVPEVRRSILNYGFPDIAHRTIDEYSLVEVTTEIRDALTRYEPRLAPHSLEIAQDNSVSKTALKVRYVVHAQLVFNPINVPVEFVADVESDTGKIVVNRV